MRNKIPDGLIQEREKCQADKNQTVKKTTLFSQSKMSKKASSRSVKLA